MVEQQDLNNDDYDFKEKIRGSESGDIDFFSQNEVGRLRYAQEELNFLLDRNYPMAPIIKLVGDRYQLSSRQRLALQRSTCKTRSYELRKAKELPIERFKEGTVYIDGFNLIITLEVALSGGIILLGQDGAMRDLAGLRGNYKIIDKTDKALKLLGKVFEELEAREIWFYLDAPISNSGRLKQKILEYGANWPLQVKADVISSPDVVLRTLDRVVTTDAVILDACRGYFNLAAYCIQKYILDANIIDLGINYNEDEDEI